MSDRVIVVDPAMQARQQIAEEMAEMAKKPLDETVPGGRYQQPDGSVRDAHGNVLDEAPKSKKDK